MVGKSPSLVDANVELCSPATVGACCGIRMGTCFACVGGQVAGVSGRSGKLEDEGSKAPCGMTGRVCSAQKESEHSGNFLESLTGENRNWPAKGLTRLRGFEVKGSRKCTTAVLEGGAVKTPKEAMSVSRGTRWAGSRDWTTVG